MSPAGKSPKGKNIGRGVAVYERPSGAGKSGAAITIETDGRVNVHLGVPDVGPGIHTVVQQIVSEVLDVPMERVNVRVEDTDSSPFDSGTGGSKSTNSVGTAAYQAVSEIKDKIVAARRGPFRLQAGGSASRKRPLRRSRSETDVSSPISCGSPSKKITAPSRT